MTIMVLSRSPSSPRRRSSPLRDATPERILGGSEAISRQSAAEDEIERADERTLMFDNEPRVREYEARWSRILAHYGRPDVYLPETLTIYAPLPEELPPPEPAPLEEAIDLVRCIHPGCTRESHAKDYCAAHYWRLKHGRPMDAPVTRRDTGRGMIRLNDPDLPHSICGVKDWREARDGDLVCRECDRRRVR